MSLHCVPRLKGTTAWRLPHGGLRGLQPGLTPMDGSQAGSVHSPKCLCRSSSEPSYAAPSPRALLHKQALTALTQIFTLFHFQNHCGDESTLPHHSLLDVLPAPPGLNPLFHNLNIVGEITLITFVNLDQYSLSHLLSFNLCQVLFTDTLMDLIIFLFFFLRLCPFGLVSFHVLCQRKVMMTFLLHPALYSYNSFVLLMFFHMVDVSPVFCQPPLFCSINSSSVLAVQ